MLTLLHCICNIACVLTPLICKGFASFLKLFSMLYVHSYFYHTKLFRSYNIGARSRKTEKLSKPHLLKPPLFKKKKFLFYLCFCQSVEHRYRSSPPINPCVMDIIVLFVAHFTWACLSVFLWCSTLKGYSQWFYGYVDLQ